jgi:hypothetical protein
MANLTWAPSPYLLNIPTVSNVTTSVTGAGQIATLQTQVNSLLTMIDTTNKKIKTNSISNFSTTPIQVTNLINFAAGATGISSFTSTSTGDYIVRSGNIYISSMGAVVTCATGNLFCDGQVYALGTVCPSDPILKKEIEPYSVDRLPTPVRFKWKESGKDDIGFLATEVATSVPEAVSTHPNGIRMVDYGKIVVAAVAEIKNLQHKLDILEKRLESKYSNTS